MSEERSNLELLHEAEKHVIRLVEAHEAGRPMYVSSTTQSVLAILTMLKQREIARTSIQLAHCEPTL